MKCEQAKKLIGKINDVVDDIKSFSSASDLEKSYLAKFLVVFICGIYEEVIETIINEKVDKHRSPEISNFIRESVKNTFRNPDIANIKGLLGQFNIDWKLGINSLALESQDAISNIVNNKNSLAHGENITITLEDTLKYYRDSMVVINKIDDLLL